MREHADNRSPEEIESDIERTRADMSSTIDALQYKLNPSELMEQAVDYALHTKPGAFSTALVNTVRVNPIPVAMVGLGIAWLMAAGRQGSHARAQYPYEARRTTFYPGADAGYDMDQEYMSSTRGGYSSREGVLQRAASKTTEAAHDLRDKASEVGQRVSDTVSGLSERAQQASQSARSRLQSSTESAQARVSEMGQRSRTEYYRAKDRVIDLVEEQPLLVGAIGIAIGAALGAALPNTRRENELMGGTRDDLVGRVKETALEQAEVVKQSAQRVAQVAKEEAERVKDDLSRTAAQGKDQTGAQFGTTGQQIH